MTPQCHVMIPLKISMIFLDLQSTHRKFFKVHPTPRFFMSADSHSVAALLFVEWSLYQGWSYFCMHVNMIFYWDVSYIHFMKMNISPNMYNCFVGWPYVRANYMYMYLDVIYFPVLFINKESISIDQWGLLSHPINLQYQVPLLWGLESHVNIINQL